MTGKKDQKSIVLYSRPENGKPVCVHFGHRHYIVFRANSTVGITALQSEDPDRRKSSINSAMFPNSSSTTYAYSFSFYI